MSSLDEISRAIGNLEARAAGLEKVVTDLVNEIRRERATTAQRLSAIERWQMIKDTERRVGRAWLALGGGMIGSLLTAIAPSLAKKLGLH